MAALSKAAANRLLIMRTIVAALRTQGPEVAEKLVERIYDGTPPPNLTVKQFLLDLADFFEASTEESAKLSAKVLTEAAEDVAATAAKDEGVALVVDEVRWQENRISGTYGEEVSRQYGFGGAVPRNADELITLTEQLEESLRKTAFPAKTRRRRDPLDNIKVADRIAAARAELVEAAEANERETRETQQARQKRDDTTDDWDINYQGVANTTYGLFKLAGKAELADRVRPTARRRQGLPEEDDLEEPAQSEQPSGEDVAEPVADEA